MPNLVNQVSELILEGHTLSSFMIPDPQIPSNNPEHLEGYHFPFAIFNEQHLWACTRSTHRAMRSRVAEVYGGDSSYFTLNSSFCYSIGQEGIFTNFTSEKSEGIFMLMNRYKSFDWLLHDSHELIWDSNFKRDFDGLRSSQSNGSELYAIYADDSGYNYMFPIDLLNVEKDEDKFNLRSESLELPVFLMTLDQNATQQVLGFLGSTEAQFKARPYTSEKVFFWNCFFEDGSFYSYSDEVSKKPSQTYQSLKIFGRKTSGGEYGKIRFDGKADCQLFNKP